MLIFVALYVYRKRRDHFPGLSVKYNSHKDDENLNEVKEGFPRAYSIDNPVYVSEPSTAVSFGESAIAVSP